MAILTIKDYKEVHLSWLSAEKQHGGEWKDNKKKCEKTALLFFKPAETIRIPAEKMLIYRAFEGLTCRKGSKTCRKKKTLQHGG